MIQVQGLSICATSLATALPFALYLLVRWLAIQLDARLLSGLTNQTRILLFASLSQYGTAACLLGLAFLSFCLPALLVFYTAAVGFSALNVVGVTRSAALVSSAELGSPKFLRV